jgi:hypothetical protein
MKKEEALQYVSADAIDAEIDVDLCRVVVSQEFRRKRFPMDKVDYREAALTRLVRMKAPFSTDGNVGWNAVKRWVRVVCPYCDQPMAPSTSSGSSGGSTHTFACVECGARLDMHMPAEHAIDVTPPRGSR